MIPELDNKLPAKKAIKLQEKGQIMAVKVDLGKCTGCGTCKDVFPVEAIELINDKAQVNEDECVDCGTCVEECPESALSLEE